MACREFQSRGAIDEKAWSPYLFSRVHSRLWSKFISNHIAVIKRIQLLCCLYYDYSSISPMQPFSTAKDQPSHYHRHVHCVVSQWDLLGLVLWGLTLSLPSACTCVVSQWGLQGLVLWGLTLSLPSACTCVVSQRDLPGLVLLRVNPEQITMPACTCVVQSMGSTRHWYCEG